MTDPDAAHSTPFPAPVALRPAVLDVSAFSEKPNTSGEHVKGALDGETRELVEKLRIEADAFAEDANDRPGDLAEMDAATAALLTAAADRIEALTRERDEARSPLTDDQVVSLIFSNLPQAAVKALTYTKWKDGIDIEFPTVSAINFADAIRRARTLLETENG